MHHLPAVFVDQQGETGFVSCCDPEHDLGIRQLGPSTWGQRSGTQGRRDVSGLRAGLRTDTRLWMNRSGSHVFLNPVFSKTLRGLVAFLLILSRGLLQERRIGVFVVCGQENFFICRDFRCIQLIFLDFEGISGSVPFASRLVGMPGGAG